VPSLSTKNRGEIGFVLIAGFLVLFGAIMIYSSSGVLAGRRMGDPAYFLKRQLLWALIAALAAGAASRIHYGLWEKWLPFLFPLASLLLVLALIPGVGKEVNGSRRWLGLWGFSIQPSEIAKLFTVIYMARYLSRRREAISDGVGLLPPLVICGVVAVLILVEPDFGTTASLLFVVALLLFVGGVPIRQLVTLVLLSAPLLGVWAMGSAYRRERLLTFIDPSRDPTGHGYQINQSYLALGGGGTLGAGLGEGRQKLGFLPEPHTDFIFAMAGEELGLLGTLLLVGLFLLLLLKGMRLALRTDDPFGRLLVAGLTLMVVIPALLNMGVVTGLLPTKGLPLPLVSYGGSSLIVNLTAIGILYNISRQPRTGGIEREPVKRGETKKRWR
jgi:cell division protein FtsW